MTLSVEAFGADRVIEPKGALPQAALRIDSRMRLQPYEIEVDVDMLCLDSTSFRQLTEANAGDPKAIGEAIEAIVAERGKMHNPVTGSGGILTGTIRDVGTSFRQPPAIGDRVVTLASLTLTPLSIDRVLEVDPSSPQVKVSGTAYLPWTAPWTFYPEDTPVDAALAALDVCNSGSQTRALIDEGTRTVLVLGGGHAGLLALAAARDSLTKGANAVLMDADRVVCERARALGLCDVAITADLRDAIGSLQALQAEGLSRADLTVVVVNASDCEAASIMLTADTGTVLFFSMATAFTKAALGSEGMASRARMLIGSGYAPDRGAYALDLIRRYDGLIEAFGDHSADTDQIGGES